MNKNELAHSITSKIANEIGKVNGHTPAVWNILPFVIEAVEGGMYMGDVHTAHLRNVIEKLEADLVVKMKQADDLGANLSAARNEISAMETQIRELELTPGRPAPITGEGITVNHVGELHLHVSFIK